MRVGLTYDLRHEYPRPAADAPDDLHGEFDTQETVDALAGALARAGHDVVKIGHLHHLLRFLGDGGQADMIFNIAEGLWGRAREAQVPAVLEAYQIPFTGSDALTLAICLNKDMTKRLWQCHGLPVAPFIVADDMQALRQQLDALPPYPLFVKPVREGSSKGIASEESIIHNEEQLLKRIDHLIKHYQQPTLIETYLPGREFTVGLLGSGHEAHVLGMAEVVSAAAGGVSGFAEKETWEEQTPDYYRAVPAGALRNQIEILALKAYRVVHCWDVGRVDIRLDRHDLPVLMEINPLPALNPRHSALPFIGRLAGIDYDTLIEIIVRSATRRQMGLVEHDC